MASTKKLLHESNAAGDICSSRERFAISSVYSVGMLFLSSDFGLSASFGSRAIWSVACGCESFASALDLVGFVLEDPETARRARICSNAHAGSECACTTSLGMSVIMQAEAMSDDSDIGIGLMSSSPQRIVLSNNNDVALFDPT